MNEQQAAVFFQLTKVDEAKRLVYGRAAQEVPDKAGEIFDYASSKPFFEKWSREQSAASFGKSDGNVRSMHKNDVSGIIVPGGLVFHDDQLAIDVCSKVVDDQDWAKVLSGAYTGFSMGGKYVKTWPDAKNPALKRYTAAPSEISLVDRPCIPSATFFEVQKADGALVKVEFSPVADDLFKAFPKDAKKGDKHTADGKDYEHDGEGWKACAAKSETVEEKTAREHAEKLGKARERFGALGVGDLRKGLLDVGHKTEDLDALTLDGLLEGYYDAVIKAEEITGRGGEVDVPGTPEEVDAFLKLLHANKLTMGKAVVIVSAVVQGKPELLGGAYGQLIRKAAGAGAVIVVAPTAAEVEAAVAARYDALVKALPKPPTEAEAVALKAQAKDLVLLKNFVTCGDFAYALSGLANLQKRTEYEAMVEGDASPLPAALKAWLASGADLLSKMVAETLKETKDNTEILQMSETATALAKRAGPPPEPQHALQKVAPEALGKLEAENATLTKSVTDLTQLVATATARLTKLEAEPRGGIRLRAIGKGEDLSAGGEGSTAVVKAADGTDQPAASLIKHLHQSGGQPLHVLAK